jgi:uncharacterized protein (TIRG00374 family)
MVASAEPPPPLASEPARARARWRDPRVWIGLAVSAVFLVLLLRRVDGAELRAALGDIEPGWLAIALVVYLVALWVRAARWRLVLRPHVAISGGDAFGLLVIGYAANNVLPVRAGELVRAGLLQQRHGTSWTTGLGAILVERVLDGLMLALFLGGTILLAGGNNLLRVLAGVGVAGFALLLGLVIALGASGEAGERRVAMLLRLLPSRLRERALTWLRGFLDGLVALRDPLGGALLIGLTAATWLLEAGAYWLVGEGFGLNLDAPLYLAVCGAANLAIAAPSTAGGIGPFEFFAREVAVAFMAPAAAATAYALVVHAFVLVPVVLLGVWMLWRQHLGFGTLWQRGRAEAEALE